MSVQAISAYSVRASDSRPELSFSTVRADKFETLIDIAIAGNDVVARRELPANPAVKFRQQSEAEGFGSERRQNFCRDESFQADPGIEAGAFRWHTGNAATGAEGDKPCPVENAADSIMTL